MFTPDGVAPTAAGADGGGGRNPAGLVFCSASSQRHAGITEELAGTLTCQHEQPYICEPSLARTLTARGDSSPCADRGQNVVAMPAITMRMREGCDGGGKGPLLQTEKCAALATRGDQYLFAPAVSVHQNGTGELSVSDTAKSLTTISTGSCRNAPLVAHGLTSKGDGDCFLSPECHPALSRGGGQAGQGYPAVLAAHPEVTGTLCASGAGLSRPAGMASEPDLCVAIPIHDRATRHQGGGPTRDGDGSGNGLGVGKAGDPAPTLTSGDHHAAAIPINTQTATRSGALGEGTGFGIGKDTDPAFTLQQAHCHAVAAVDCRNYKEVGDVSGTLQAKDKPGYSLNYQKPVRAGYIVRRLTPTECERLQGFPDGWTKTGHDGKEISDTRRYQMLGNSVAVPCVAFILSGVAGQLSQAQEEAA